MIYAGRVGTITNLVASADLVVAIFPKALQTLKVQYLRSAGHDGFSNFNLGLQVEFLQGGHGIGVAEDLWDIIAEYVVNGNREKRNIKISKPKRNGFIWIIGCSSPLPFLIIISGFIFLPFIYVIYHSCWTLERQVLVLGIYYFIIWKVVTKL